MSPAFRALLVAAIASIPTTAPAQAVDGASATWRALPAVGRFLRMSPTYDLLTPPSGVSAGAASGGGGFRADLVERANPACTIRVQAGWVLQGIPVDAIGPVIRQGTTFNAGMSVEIIQDEACLHPIRANVTVRPLDGVLGCQGINMPWAQPASLRLIHWAEGGPGYVEATAEAFRNRAEAFAETTLRVDDTRTAGGHHYNAPSGIFLALFSVGDMTGEACYPFAVSQ
ncbi:hypothetical protein [Gymnodinialimonas sp.]